MMAQRFGGRFSPASQPAAVPATTDAPVPPPPRLRLMFILPYLFLISAYFNRSPDQLLLGLGAFAALTAAAFLSREGLRARAEYDARQMARPPKLPRLLLGAALMALGLGLGAHMGGQPPLYLGLLAALGAGLHLLAFGMDPLRAKGTEGIDPAQSDRVARAIDEAEAMLAAMAEAIRPAGERALLVRVETFAHTARGLFRNIEADPGDLTAARKYLTVYLMGARDATIKFAQHYAQTRDASARAEYESLLRDLETTFAARSQALIGQGRTGLDIEIQVLRERLKLET
jgi:hypothetical protein